MDLTGLANELAEKSVAHAQALAELTEFKPVLLQVQERFALDDFERDLLLLALAPALDGSFNALFGRTKGSAYRAALDVDAALTILRRLVRGAYRAAPDVSNT